MRSTLPSPPVGENDTPWFEMYSAPSGPFTSPFGRVANPVSTSLRSPVLGSNVTRFALSAVHGLS